MDELEQLLRGAIPGQLLAIALEIPENGSGIGTSPDGGPSVVRYGYPCLKPR